MSSFTIWHKCCQMRCLPLLSITRDFSLPEWDRQFLVAFDRCGASPCGAKNLIIQYFKPGFHIVAEVPGVARIAPK